MRPFASLGRAFRAMRRRHDLRAVWPLCQMRSYDVEEARHYFLSFCLSSPHWTVDFTEVEVQKLVGNLK